MKSFLSCCCSCIILMMMMLSLSLAEDPAPTPEYMEAAKKLHELTVLKFGEACKSEDGEKLRALTKEIIEVSKAGTFNKAQADILKDMKALLNGKYCDSLKALECKDDNKCGCLSLNDSGVKLEAEPEGDTCKLKKGSSCVGEIADEHGDVATFGCKSGLKCVLKSDGKSDCKVTAAELAKAKEAPCQCA